MKYIFHYMTVNTKKCVCPHCDVHCIPSLIMATIRARGLFVPFTMPLEDDSHVNVPKDLVGLRFTLQIGTTYMEQEISTMDGDTLKTILMQKN